MNPLHYPSPELCEKLTNIDFPETEIMLDSIKTYRIGGMNVFPSVMEMLDVMPIEIKKDNIGYMLVLWGNGCVQYYPDNFNSFHIPLADFRGTFGNALAEMILWLHENKYITFNNDK